MFYFVNVVIRLNKKVILHTRIQVKFTQEIVLVTFSTDPHTRIFSSDPHTWISSSDILYLPHTRIFSSDPHIRINSSDPLQWPSRQNWFKLISNKNKF